MYPVLFHVGSRPVYAWGLLLMIGFLLAAWRGARVARRYGLAPEDVWDASLLGLLGGIVGGRLVYVALEWKHFAANPAEIFQIWTGGMTSFGGLIGGVLAGLAVARLRKMNVGDSADLAAVSLPIGYGIGRVGCFLNGCCYGGQCDLPWAVDFRHADGTTTGPAHPAQLYSAFAALVMYVVLVQVEKRRRFRGQQILLFCIMYGVYRFLIEFVREGATASLSGIASLTQAQVACVLIVAAAGAVYATLSRRRGAASADEPPATTVAPV